MSGGAWRANWTPSSASAAAGDHRQRQRHGVDLQRHPGLGRPALASTGTTSPRASLSRTASSRASTAGLRDELLNETAPLAAAREGRAGGLAARLQRSATHSKLGWMTPQAYARALRGETGRLGDLTVARPALLPPTTTKAQINPGLSLWLDEKRGSRQQINESFR